MGWIIGSGSIYPAKSFILTNGGSAVGVFVMDSNAYGIVDGFALKLSGTAINIVEYGNTYGWLPGCDFYCYGYNTDDTPTISAL